MRVTCARAQLQSKRAFCGAVVDSPSGVLSSRPALLIYFTRRRQNLCPEMCFEISTVPLIERERDVGLSTSVRGRRECCSWDERSGIEYEHDTSSAQSQPCIYGANFVQHLTALQDSKLKAQLACLSGRSQHVENIPVPSARKGKPAR